MSLPPLATIADLEIRLGVDPGSLAGNDLARAEANIADASHLVRTASGLSWVDSTGAANPPESVVVVVLQVAKRVYTNPDGLASETVSADGASYSASNNQAALGTYLTDDELTVVRTAVAEAVAASGAWRGTGSVRTPKPAYRGLPAGYRPWVWRP
jgi:hypothetical protein